jgi:hypothetical protein
MDTIYWWTGWIVIHGIALFAAIFAVTWIVSWFIALGTYYRIMYK